MTTHIPYPEEIIDHELERAARKVLMADDKKLLDRYRGALRQNNATDKMRESVNTSSASWAVKAAQNDVIRCYESNPLWKTFIERHNASRQR